MWKLIPHAAAHDPEDRVQLHKPNHYTIYKIKQEKNNNCKKRAKRTIKLT